MFKFIFLRKFSFYAEFEYHACARSDLKFLTKDFPNCLTPRIKIAKVKKKPVSLSTSDAENVALPASTKLEELIIGRRLPNYNFEFVE